MALEAAPSDLAASRGVLCSCPIALPLPVPTTVLPAAFFLAVVDFSACWLTHMATLVNLANTKNKLVEIHVVWFFE